jgi:hypothetical protein
LPDYVVILATSTIRLSFEFVIRVSPFGNRLANATPLTVDAILERRCQGCVPDAYILVQSDANPYDRRDVAQRCAACDGRLVSVAKSRELLPPDREA